MWGYRTRDVARMLGLPPAEVRRFARAGVVSARRGPRNTLRFSFQDLVLLRTAAGLLHARLPPARVRRALRALASQLPAGRGLASVHVAAEGGHVIVREGGARWHPETGQALLDFEVRALPRRVAPLVRAAARRGRARPLDAEAWFRWGRDLHEVAPAEARTAYRQALAVAPDHAGAHLHLGRLLREGGDPRAAELHLRRALEDPAQRAAGALELSAALEAQGLLDEALLACARALEADPALEDAHRAAARLLEQLGRGDDARRQLDALHRLGRA